MKTFVLKAKDIKREWYVIDAAGQPVGRVAAKAAHILMGKHKPTYTPHLDNGDFVVIINAGKVMLTGRKPKTKIYYRYSGYVGGMKEATFLEMIRRNPVYPLQKAIKGMMRKNKLAKKMVKKLYLFPGSEHTLKNVTLKKIEL
ncbi:LSU ribosomal protein L13p (L13Ae) [Brevinematales bacterium NS]|jgi:large subunit ribosomal protein L13|nr:50S ribosomal protein L13 [Brevinematales bacterium]QJR21109.1 LSU ribosomal protein L13p (L13Ae) [Brevinematales bacterium NS]